MTREKLKHLAAECGFSVAYVFPGDWVLIEPMGKGCAVELERFYDMAFADGAAAERAKVVEWMAEQGYATGHGDTTEDMLKELEWQIAEREREACARMCEVEYAACWHNSAMAAAKAAERCATAIRLRGGK